MFGTALRPWIDPPLQCHWSWLAARGVTADQVTVAGFGIGVGAALSVAFGQFGLGLALILSNRLAEGLDGAIAPGLRSRPITAGFST
jgi:phosphatidylglycerophosphate synthase